MEKVDEEAALAVRCPTCWKPPGTWCVYARRPTLETARLHPKRRYQYWVMAPASRNVARTGGAPLRVALREFDAREERALRGWLELHAALLTGCVTSLDLDDTPT